MDSVSTTTALARESELPTDAASEPANPTALRPAWQSLLSFFVPLVAANALSIVSVTLSAVWIGRLLSVNALAAAMVITAMISFLIALLVALASGGSILIGQASGAGSDLRVKQIAGTVIRGALAVGIVVAILGVTCTRAALQLMSTPDDIIGSAELFGKVIFVAMPVIAPYLCYSTILYGTEDSKTPLFALLVSTLISTALSPLLIDGFLGLPKMGLTGVAVAFVVGYIAAFGFLLIYLRASAHEMRLTTRLLLDCRSDWKRLRAVVALGVPASVQILMVSLAELILIALVNRFGSQATAAWGATLQILGFIQLPVGLVGTAVAVLGARCIGARRLDRFHEVNRAAFVLTLAISIVGVAAGYCFSWAALGWFITDGKTLAVAHDMFVAMLWSVAGAGLTGYLAGIMRATGTVLWPTLIDVFSICGVGVVAAYLLMAAFGVLGVAFGVPIAVYAGLVFTVFYYLYFWKRKSSDRAALLVDL